MGKKLRFQSPYTSWLRFAGCPAYKKTPIGKLCQVAVMSFERRWNPTLAGRALPICKIFESAVAKGLSPEEPEWTEEAVVGAFPGISQVQREELWESVFALWHLRQEEVKGVEDSIWRQHVSAWLVRKCWCLF